MYTIVETPTFAADARVIWSEEERGAFCAWLAAHPDAGDVIPGSGGCRKVIYFNQRQDGEIWLLVIYTKQERGNIPGHILKSIREALEDE